MRFIVFVVWRPNINGSQAGADKFGIGEGSLPTFSPVLPPVLATLPARLPKLPAGRRQALR